VAALVTDTNTDCLVTMVTFITKVTNVPVVTFATIVRLGYHRSFIAMVCEFTDKHP